MKVLLLPGLSVIKSGKLAVARRYSASQTLQEEHMVTIIINNEDELFKTKKKLDTSVY